MQEAIEVGKKSKDFLTAESQVIQALAYTRQTEECPECKGSGFKGDKIGRYFWGCEKCGTISGGSGKKEFMSLVVRRFEKCEWKEKAIQKCDCCTEDCYDNREQTFKVGEKYKFALQTGKCTDCRLMSLGFCERETQRTLVVG
jgi:hypothetical protein